MFLGSLAWMIGQLRDRGKREEHTPQLVRGLLESSLVYPARAGSHPGFVIDCPDAGALATFYGALLGWKVETSDGWADIRPADGSQCISFQQVDAYTPPVWPGQQVPQQIHLDVMVEDLDAAEPKVLEPRRDQTRPAARHHLPGLPRPGGPPVLPLRRLSGAGQWSGT